MLSFFIMFLGLGLVIWSLYSIRRDIETGNVALTKGLSGVSDRNLEKIICYLDELEKQMNDMNAAFYDLVSDLEGSYSVHEKEISLLEERLERLEKQKGVVNLELRQSELPVDEPLEPEVNDTTILKTETLGLTPEEANAMKLRILALRKEGHSLTQIAKILNVGIGELQLFIKLNTK